MPFAINLAALRHSKYGSNQKSTVLMKKILIITIFFMLSGGVISTAEEAVIKPGLSELAAESDLVALAQVVITEYEYTRGFPSKGLATLRILIPYKSPAAFDHIQVFEEGLKDRECYFPEITAWQEGQRFLVFMQHLEAEQFKGHPRACALSILVTDNNEYALRMPQDTITLSSDGESLVQEFVYADPAARIDTTELTGISIEKMQQELKVRRLGDDLVYTQGISLTDVRRLIGPEALATD